MFMSSALCPVTNVNERVELYALLPHSSFRQNKKTPGVQMMFLLQLDYVHAAPEEIPVEYPRHLVDKDGFSGRFCEHRENMFETRSVFDQQKYYNVFSQLTNRL